MNDLERIMALIGMIHYENMGLVKMLLPREKGNEIIEHFEKQFKEILNTNFDNETEVN